MVTRVRVLELALSFAGGKRVGCEYVDSQGVLMDEDDVCMLPYSEQFMAFLTVKGDQESLEVLELVKQDSASDGLWKIQRSLIDRLNQKLETKKTFLLDDLSTATVDAFFEHEDKITMLYHDSAGDECYCDDMGLGIECYLHDLEFLVDGSMTDEDAEEHLYTIGYLKR